MKLIRGFIVGFGAGIAILSLFALLFGPAVYLGDYYGQVWGLICLLSEFVILCAFIGVIIETGL